nr:glycosyltransferase family 2 protein [Streptomyces viridochromogenes]
MPVDVVPDVSVIIGAYNAMPYLTRCVTSVMEQTIGYDRIELIAVDDGSTDGTGAELDRLAQEFPGVMRVVHQANSGGPSAPRNAGLELARGRYVFFLDADDHLGPQALERMVAMADANGSEAGELCLPVKVRSSSPGPVPASHRQDSRVRLEMNDRSAVARPASGHRGGAAVPSIRGGRRPQPARPSSVLTRRSRGPARPGAAAGRRSRRRPTSPP